MANMKEKTDFITIPKAAGLCGVDRRTMWRWVKSKKIESFVTPGGHHRISRSAIDALLDRNGPSADRGNQNKAILVIDDDEPVRKALYRRLTREHFRVETVADGFTAGIKVQTFQPDLLILDLVMEGVDGFEVCRTIRADPALNHIKVLVFTGFDTPQNREKALLEGADGYLPKTAPFRDVLREICAMVEEIQS